VTLRASPYPAKLTAPRSARVLARPRLYKRLDEASGYPVTWISGPPGAGKTTLAASYVEARKLPCIWFRLDSGDDAETFFHYLGIAARRAPPRSRTPLPVLKSEHLPTLGIFAGRYFEALCARWQGPAVLVLDNYQDLPESSILHTIVAAAALALPERVRLMVLSHAPPPPPLARLQAGGAVALLDGAEFTLTVPEALALSRLLEKGKVKPALVRRLHERTDGWVAGLVLLLGRPDLEETAPTEKTGQLVLFDYFQAEILSPLDSATQTMLCLFAFLPELTATLAEDLTGDSRAGLVLADLHRRSHFVVRRGADAYQFHPLFREFLLSRAQRIFKKGKLDAFRAKAARLLEASGHLEASADQLRAASNWDAMAALVLKHAPTLAGQARFRTLESWLHSLPAPMLDREPWLRYWFAVCLMSYDPGKARGHFEEALRRFHKGADRAGAVLSWAGVVDASLYLGRDFAALDHWIEKFPAIAGSEPLAPQLNDALVVRMFGALALRQPHHPDIESWRDRTQALLEANGDPQLRLWAGVHLCNYFASMGHTGRARQCRNWLSTLARAEVFSPLMLLLVRATQALVAWLVEADAERSLKVVGDALAYAEKTGIHVWDHNLMCHGVAAALTVGDLGKAREMLKGLATRPNQTRLLDVGYYHSMCHWDALLRGDLVLARAHGDASAALEDSLGMPFVEALFYLERADLLDERGAHEDSRRYLRQAQRIGGATHSRLIDFVVALGEARLAARERDEGWMRERLEHAFAVGRDSGLATFHGWRAEPMADLCARALEAGIETSYVAGLIRRRGLRPPAWALSLEVWPWPIRLYTLGRFAVESGGKATPSPGKLARKPLDLLKHLISAGPRGVSSALASEALWPDQDPERSYHAYGMALHRLRKLLGSDDSILSRDGGIVLNPQLVFVDAWAFERLLERQGECGEAKLEQALALYRGAFLGTSGPEDRWSLTYGERLFSKYLRAALRLGQHRQERSDFEGALDVYGGVLEQDDLQESVHQRLLGCYLAMGRRAEGLRAYERCRKRLRQTLHIPPSPQTEALKAQLLQSN